MTHPARRLIGYAAGAAVLLVVAGCEPPPPPPKPEMALTPVAYETLSGWTADDPSAAVAAFRRSCTKLSRLPRDRAMGPDGIGGTVGDWLDVCADAAAVANATAETARAFFEQRFVPHRITFGNDDEGLFTGYYEAELRGAWSRKPPFTVPIYRRPKDLITADLSLFDPDWKGRRIIGRVADGKLVPYHTRPEIEAGALAGRDLELLWVDDPVDAFFLHIQGSGRVRMTDGSTVRVGYAGKNGRPYVAIGRPLIERGAIPKEKMSMQAIRNWLAAHPDQMDDVLNLNRSYVFFHRLEGVGPIGAQGVPLTPGRSLAVDTNLLPLGVPIWLDTTDPLNPETPLQRLVIAQDTGGAIKGAIRGDLFWGHGDQAAAKAGAMKQQGRYFLLLPKGVPTS